MFFLCQNESVTLAMPLLTPQLLVLESNSLSIRCFQYHNGIFQQSWFHYLFVYLRTPHGVWKSLLDESEKKAKQQLAISEELQGQMAESMKTLKSNKAQVFKKVCVTQYIQNATEQLTKAFILSLSFTCRLNTEKNELNIWSYCKSTVKN